ncbi:MAG TPA: DUF6526 family protein [Thermoanaerobaculia bacterium]|jgi:hypothetical protein|nr:DUF6526 family protein [Thermoanaerobaculia bacterium]
MPEQTYATHRRYDPRFHFVILPVLGINALIALYFVYRSLGRPTILYSLWNAVVALILVLLALTVRAYATGLQDRIVRLEERLRLERILPDDLRPRIGELTTGQLIGLRFCDDAEVGELTRAALAGELRGREDIKKRITSWRADHHRV